MINPKITETTTKLFQFDSHTEQQLKLMSDWLTELIILAILEKQRVETSLKLLKPVNPIESV